MFDFWAIRRNSMDFCALLYSNMLCLAMGSPAIVVWARQDEFGYVWSCYEWLGGVALTFMLYTIVRWTSALYCTPENSTCPWGGLQQWSRHVRLLFGGFLRSTLLRYTLHDSGEAGSIIPDTSGWVRILLVVICMSALGLNRFDFVVYTIIRRISVLYCALIHSALPRGSSNSGRVKVRTALTSVIHCDSMGLCAVPPLMCSAWVWGAQKYCSRHVSPSGPGLNRSPVVPVITGVPVVPFVANHFRSETASPPGRRCTSARHRGVASPTLRPTKVDHSPGGAY
ncbi:hypothetical protein WN48_10599 [Eufriesea mexicana]|uniref:Uncharacterized protein n=1 Tax=Eufriesea mexicana TaxID=516756 RepID=A0A310SGM9_9HYME|nr:hypothetical protein WN48_10599 [Eufriesea mexicana]